jgi:hypothetical protein
MSKTSPDSREVVSLPVPPRLWGTLPQVHQRALVALLAACLFKQMAVLASHPVRQEVQREPPLCR